MADQDVFYANLACQLEEQARSIIAAMENAGLKRLIFIRSTGINNEVPDENHGSILEPYRRAASVIETSAVEHTILRPAWLNDRNEIDYATTEKRERFENPNETVSRKNVADLAVKIAMTPGLEGRRSLGVHKNSQ